MGRPLRLGLGLVLAAALCGSAAAVEIEVDGRPLVSDAPPQIVNETTYVPLRAVTQALSPGAEVGWEGRAVVRGAGLTLTAEPGAPYIEANGRALYVKDGVLARQGRTMVPIRALARAMGAAVEWDASTGTVRVYSGGGPITAASSYYKEDELYWLSRIISAESRGEPLTGKIAVGNVVLNRVGDGGFPDTIYGVIFDDRWGGQFEPVRNGTIYAPPTGESVLAAKLCLEGADIAGDSLYFLAPALTSNHWIMENRPYVMTIGAHWFYR